MSTVYMLTWSVLMVSAVGIWRLRNWRQTVGVALVTGLVLMVSQTLVAQLAATIGLTPDLIFSAPEQFFLSGPIGWLALIVMPCGWLGPIIGLNLFRNQDEAQFA